jgi:endoglucanase
MLASAALLVALAASGCGNGAAARAGTPTATSEARAAIDRFLDRYVTADGRVVRRDQGADTVSEGQAYALALTAAAGDGERFELVWKWTRTHLQRSDGLLAWHWGDGRVVDAQPATDADLDTAQALMLAARRFSRADLRTAAARIATSVLAHETAIGDGGERLLVAGPWAVTARIVNPSYFSPRAYAALAGTGDPVAWQQLRAQAVARAATTLPPDWATAGATATPGRAIGGPDPREAATARYGFDAVRVAIRMGGACDAASRAVAGRLWPALSGADAALLPRRLDGPPISGATPHAVALVGAAGAARGAGRSADVARLLDAASARDRAVPTYYGAAWVALGRVLLTTDLAGRCPPS